MKKQKVPVPKGAGAVIQKEDGTKRYLVKVSWYIVEKQKEQRQLKPNKQLR